MSESPGRRPLLRRMLSLMRRNGVALLQYGYIYAYAVPLLRLRGVISGPVTVSRGYQSFLLLTPNRCIKLSISKKSTLRDEYHNYVSLTALHPQITPLLPDYRLIEGRTLTALFCERLSRVESEMALPLAVEIQGKLGEVTLPPRSSVLADYPLILAGLGCIEIEFGQEVASLLKWLVDRYLSSGKYSEGLAHGDFHSRNIMLDEFGNGRLIDLDCVRVQGIRDFDALYFVLEQEWSASGNLWTKTLGDCLAGNNDKATESLERFGIAWSDDLAFAFFLDRVGQDKSNYGISYSRDLLEPVVNVANSLYFAAN